MSARTCIAIQKGRRFKTGSNYLPQCFSEYLFCFLYSYEFIYFCVLGLCASLPVSVQLSWLGFANFRDRVRQSLETLQTLKTLETLANIVEPAG